MTTIVVLISIFMALSAFFSATETALFSIPRERIDSFKDNAAKSKKLIYSLLLDGQRTLLLLLLCNLFVNITLTGLINSAVISVVDRNATLISFGVATVMILLFGEIFPKTLALRFNVGIAGVAAPVLHSMIFILSPILNVVQRANRFFLKQSRLLLKNPSPFITIDELKTAVRGSFDRGVISRSEQRIVSELLDKGALPASRFMTHRSQVVFLPHYTTVAYALKAITEAKQTCALITRDERSQNVLGVAHISELLCAPQSGRCRRFAQPPQWIHATIAAADLASDMLAQNQNVVCLLDEFGGLLGIFTLENALGSMMNFRKSTARSGGNSAKVFKGTDEIDGTDGWLPDDLVNENKNVRTVNGLLTQYLGRIPDQGERFEVDDFQFYVIRSSATKIESVLVRKY